jgi:hypothetical protein
MDKLMELTNEFSEKFDLTDIDFSVHYTGRTFFQLERFVMGEHDLPERKFLQLMMELKTIRDGFVHDSLEVEKLKIQIKRLLDTGDEIDKIEAMKKQYNLSFYEAGMVCRQEEVKHIAKLLKQLPKIYTKQEIEAAEERYWEKRLVRQAAEELVGTMTGINPGNMRSNIQAKTSISNLLLELQNQSINNIKESTLLPSNVTEKEPENYYNQVVFSNPVF